MTTIAPADSLAARFERIVQEHRDEIAPAKTVADKMRSDVVRPLQGADEPALIYRFPSE